MSVCLFRSPALPAGCLFLLPGLLSGSVKPVLRCTVAALALVLNGAVAVPAQAQPVSAQLPLVTLYAGMHKIEAELAISPEQRATGLMWRKQLPQNRGMLFVFETPGVQCFWMKNTFVPLSVAFLRNDGTITNIEDMQPQSTDSHCSTEPVRYVLEMNQGWFQQRNIKAGMRIIGLK